MGKHFEYLDAASLWDAALAEPTTNAGRDGRKEHFDGMKHNPGWYGGLSSMAAARSASIAGETPAFTGAAIASAHAAIAPALRPRIVASVAGGAVNVAAYLAGEPECMRRIIRTPRPIEVTRVRIVASVSAHVDAEALAHYGKALAEALDALSRGGRTVEVWISYPCADSYMGEAEYTWSVRAKAADAMLDWQSLAFWVANSDAAFRIACFGLMDATMHESLRAKWSAGRGYPTRRVPALSCGEAVVIETPNDSAACRAATAEALADRIVKASEAAKAARGAK